MKRKALNTKILSITIKPDTYEWLVALMAETSKERRVPVTVSVVVREILEEKQSTSFLRLK